MVEEIKIDLIYCEWKAYLQWGHAASPDNKGFFDVSKLNEQTEIVISPLLAGQHLL